jgi:hypothetical protein
MFAINNAISSADAAVHVDPPFDVNDITNALQVSNSHMFQRVKHSHLLPGNLVVVMVRAANAVDNSYAGLDPTQIILRVTSTQHRTVLAETVHNQYDNLNNRAPVQHLHFTITPPVTRANGAHVSGGEGSTHFFSEDLTPYVYILTDTGILRAGRLFQTARIIALGGVSGTPGPDAQLAITLPPNVPAAPGGAAQPSAVHHQTTRESMRLAALLPITRILTRDVALAAGRPTPSDFVETMMGPHGMPSDDYAFMTGMAILSDPVHGVVTSGRLVCANKTNLGFVYAFGFTANDTVVTNGIITNGLTIEAFGRQSASGGVTFATSVSDLHACLMECIQVYECLYRPGLAPDDTWMLTLCTPLVKMLRADTNLTRVLNEPYIITELLAQRINTIFFKVRLAFNDKSCTAPGYTWAMFVTRIHALMVFDVREFANTCARGTTSIYGFQRRAAASQHLTNAPVSAAQQKKDINKAVKEALDKQAKKAARNTKVPRTIVQNTASATSAPSTTSTTGNSNILYCAYFLAHELGVQDGKGMVFGTCSKGTACRYEHRGKPAQRLSAAEKSQWITDYSSGGTLLCRPGLLQAIKRLP